MSDPKHRPSRGDSTLSPAIRPARKRGLWRPWLKLVIGLLAGYAVVTAALGVYWCQQPPPLDVHALAQAQSSETSAPPVPGSTFVATTIAVAETLLNKPGGFLHNDRLPPGVLVDNCPSWECGVIMALRDALRALRNDFSRTQTQSAENLDLKRADLQFAIDPKCWIMPAAEDEYQKGIDALKRYLDALNNGRVMNGRFSVRADNLAEYLALVEKRLGNFGLRLSANTTAGAMPSFAHAGKADRAESAAAPAEDAMIDEAPLHWTAPERIDNVFYCARGYSWAFRHFMQALRIDFAPVVADKTAGPTMAQIERDLRGASKPMRSPLVLMGSGYGFLANHSMVLSSYIARVNAAVLDLRLLLQQG